MGKRRSETDNHVLQKVSVLAMTSQHTNEDQMAVGSDRSTAPLCLETKWHQMWLQLPLLDITRHPPQGRTDHCLQSQNIVYSSGQWWDSIILKWRVSKHKTSCLRIRKVECAALFKTVIGSI